MISLPDEAIDTIIKWNTTLQTELIIESTEENINITGTKYRVIAVDVTKCRQNVSLNSSEYCETESNYDSIEISVVIVLFLLIVVTVIGNTLIISAVVTTKRLRTVTNCFVTSLAVADLLVGIFVMPPAIAVHITGKYIII